MVLSTDAEQGQPSVSVEGALVGLAEMLLDETGLDTAVDNVLLIGTRALGDGCALSLTISRPDVPSERWSTRAATTELAKMLDEWQYEHDEGPCIAADREGRMVVSRDLAEDDRFPAFAQVALERGVVACVSSPMLVHESSLGSINAFYGDAARLNDDALTRIEQLTSTSAPVLANWLAHHRATELASQLTEALEHRGTIERAKGLLMGELDVDDQRAFELLRAQSQHENVKLREVAARLLEDRAKSRAT